MKISEVEQRSGLSAKTIRFYEKKGLLHVQRSLNDYRDYDESIIKELMIIKTLRKLEIPIAIILKYKSEECTLQEVLQKQLSTFETNQLRGKIQTKVTHDLLNKLEEENTNELVLLDEIAALEGIETDEFQEVSKDLVQLEQHSLTYYVCMSLTLSGPILWLFINLSVDPPLRDVLLLNAVLALFATVGITLLWQHYIRHRHEYKKKKKGNFKIFLFLVLSFVLGLCMFAACNYIIYSLFVKEGYLMYSLPHIYSMLTFFFMIELMCIAGSYVYRNTKNTDLKHFDWFWKFFIKYKLPIIILNVIIFYLCIFNHAVIYPSHMEVKKWYAPMGINYQIKDVEKVRSGFYGHMFSLTTRRKGDFYYYVDMKDGTTIDLSQPYPNDEKKYEEHTYLEIEEYDAYLMNNGVTKESSTDYQDNNTLDPEYKNRFLKIIHNK